MAYYDSRLGKYVVRIVYDGAPLSGKTTSLVTLAGLLGRKGDSAVFSPGEASGRTLFFDWLDYEGGLYNGKGIRCQIVSVPGQKALDDRRQRLLSTADAIIFVFDTTEDRYGESLEYFRDLSSACSDEVQTAPGILVQANKRDLVSAVPMTELKEALGNAKNVGVIESSAVSGDGVRHSFVLGVGLALDRIAALQAAGQLPNRIDGDIDTGEGLLQWLRGEEGVADLHEHVSIDEHQVDEVASPDGDTIIARRFAALLGEQQQDRAAAANDDSGVSKQAGIVSQLGQDTVGLFSERELSVSGDDCTVAIPSVSVPAGFIWPPVEGRLIVNEVTSDADLVVSEAHDRWLAQSKHWTLVSLKTDFFENPSVARPALIELVKNHIKLKGLLSGGRCVALSPDGDKWRLWQIARKEQSVATALKHLFRSKDAVRIADLIFRYGELILRASKLFGSSGVALPVEAATIGASKGDPVYLGWIPSGNSGESEDVSSASTVVRAEIRRMFGETPDMTALSVPLIVDRLKVHAKDDAESAMIVDVASSVLIGH